MHRPLEPASVPPLPKPSFLPNPHTCVSERNLMARDFRVSCSPFVPRDWHSVWPVAGAQQVLLLRNQASGPSKVPLGNACTLFL